MGRHCYETFKDENGKKIYNIQICKNCGILRLNAYRGKIQYYENDRLTPKVNAGECPGKSYKQE